jgi:hypothetical protein
METVSALGFNDIHAEVNAFETNGARYFFFSYNKVIFNNRNIGGIEHGHFTRYRFSLV